MTLNIDDVCAQGFQKEWRMFWAKEFIKAWLVTPEMQFGCNLDSLTMQANNWIRKSVDLRQAYPIVSTEDVKEAILQILGDD